MEKGQRARSLW